MSGSDQAHSASGESSRSFRAVVAFKELVLAKSRMQELDPAIRARLAELMLVHTVSVLDAAGGEVIVVSATPGVGVLLRAHGLEIRVVPDPGQGLNAAFSTGAEIPGLGDRPVLACMADLAGLQAEGLRAVLSQARRNSSSASGRWYVPDLQGRGTTMLLARGVALDPCFGGDSARRHHESGAERLEAPDPLRRDVDTVIDLIAAAAEPSHQECWRALLAISASLDPEDPPPVEDLVRPDTATITAVTDDGLTVIRSRGTRVSVGRDRIAAELPRPAVGQRVHLALDADDQISHLWL